MPGLTISHSQTTLVDTARAIVDKRNKTKTDKQYLAFVIFQLRMHHFKNAPTIAGLLGMKVGTVQRYISETIDDIITSTRMDATKEIEMQIQMLETMLSDAWDMWKKSCGQSVTLTQRASGIQGTLDEIADTLGNDSPENDEGGEAFEGANDMRVSRTIRSKGGDPRFLAEMRNILADLRKLKGIHDPPKQHIHYAKVEGSVEVNVATPELTQMDNLLALLVGQNILPNVIEGEFSEAPCPALPAPDDDDDYLEDE